jgi:hypothetical protein
VCILYRRLCEAQEFLSVVVVSSMLVSPNSLRRDSNGKIYALRHRLEDKRLREKLSRTQNRIPGRGYRADWRHDGSHDECDKPAGESVESTLRSDVHTHGTQLCPSSSTTCQMWSELGMRRRKDVVQGHVTRRPSCVIVLNNADDEAPRVCLLTGVAGSGKSAVAHSVAALYDGQKRLGSSYCFSTTDAATRNSTNLFSTIARDLCDHDAQYKSALWAVVKEERAMSLVPLS